MIYLFILIILFFYLSNQVRDEHFREFIPRENLIANYPTPSNAPVRGHPPNKVPLNVRRSLATGWAVGEGGTPIIHKPDNSHQPHFANPDTYFTRLNNPCRRDRLTAEDFYNGIYTYPFLPQESEHKWKAANYVDFINYNRPEENRQIIKMTSKNEDQSNMIPYASYWAFERSVALE